MQRRSFLKNSSLALVGAGGIKSVPHVKAYGESQNWITISLNAYSFNKPLLEGEMSLDELFRFAKKTGFAGVDLTAYYIPGYPEVPEDKVLYEIKRSAFRQGIAISGTGVRNDFTLQDTGKHLENIELVKGWIVAASKLGAPQVRVFFGRGEDDGRSREKVKAQVIDAFQECADFASHHGVMVAFQNHKDYIKSTSEIIEVTESVKSDWFGLMLDIGSVAGPDPYAGIEKLIPYAVTWQVKENVTTDQGSSPTDFPKLMKIVADYPYHGYFPLETLGEGDPKKKVVKLFQKVTQSMA